MRRKVVVISTVKKNFYQDSLKLMQISQKLSARPGIKEASAIMATEANLRMLKDTGLIKVIPDSVNANDLIVAIEAESENVANDAVERLDPFLVPPNVDVAAKPDNNTSD